jgi:hypothetical protein
MIFLLQYGGMLPLSFVDRKMGMANVLFYVILPDFVLRKMQGKVWCCWEFGQMNLGQECSVFL